jgi:signal peptidase I
MGGFVKVVGGFFLDIIETVVIALSIFLIVYLFVMQPHQVNGQSMYPNFENGEYLLTDKISYRFNQPERGDIVVFKAPDAAQCPEGAGCDFIKRIVGLPGDSVEITDQGVYVNNSALPEEYIPVDVDTRPMAYTQNGPVSVPQGSYFVMGDNRPHSSDSRAWGPVPFSNIVGKVFFRYWPPAKVGTLNHGKYTNIALPDSIQQLQDTRE